MSLDFSGLAFNLPVEQLCVCIWLWGFFFSLFFQGPFVAVSVPIKHRIKTWWALRLGSYLELHVHRDAPRPAREWGGSRLGRPPYGVICACFHLKACSES